MTHIAETTRNETSSEAAALAYLENLVVDAPADELRVIVHEVATGHER